MCAAQPQPHKAPSSSSRSAGASAQVSGASTVEKDGAASPLCPYVALAELIGFHQQVSGFQGFARETHLCALLPRAAQGRALTARGTGVAGRSLTGKRSLLEHGTRHVPQTAQRRPGSGTAPPAQPARCRALTARVTAAAAQLRCRPSEPRRLPCSPERPLESVKHFLRSSLPLRAGCNQTACARGQQAAERNPQRSLPAVSRCC